MAEIGDPRHTPNLGGSIGKRGLGAPGENVMTLGPDGDVSSQTGTSFAAPFVTGALLWSLFPKASAAEVRKAVIGTRRRTSVTPPLLDAWSAYQMLSISRTAEAQA